LKESQTNYARCQAPADSLTRALHSHAGAHIAPARGHTLADAHRAYDDDPSPPLRVSPPPPSPTLCLFAPAVREVALINLCDLPVRVYALSARASYRQSL